MEQKQIDWTLIQKLIDGNLTENEKKQLESWMRGDEKRQRFVKQARLYYKRDLPVIDETRILNAWQYFVQIQKEKQKKRTWGMRIWWSVAAIFILFIASWLWVSTSQRSLDERPSQMFTLKNNDIRLIISDGTEINLTSKKLGNTTIDKGTNVQLEEKSLSYEKNQSTQDTLYHIVEVPRGGEYQLTLSDGSRVWLNAESRLAYPTVFGKSERRVHLEGEAFFEVKPGNIRFVVETEDMDVRVLGTTFNVNAYKDEQETRTTLVQGKVEVLACKDSLQRILQPGEQAIFAKTRGQLDVKQVNTDLYTRWVKGQFVFRDTPLSDIMRTLSRWYEMEYEFVDTELKNYRFYGVISRFDQVENLLHQFEKTGKVHFEFQKNKVIVKK